MCSLPFFSKNLVTSSMSLTTVWLKAKPATTYWMSITGACLVRIPSTKWLLEHLLEKNKSNNKASESEKKHIKNMQTSTDGMTGTVLIGGYSTKRISNIALITWLKLIFNSLSNSKMHLGSLNQANSWSSRPEMLMMMLMMERCSCLSKLLKILATCFNKTTNLMKSGDGATQNKIAWSKRCASH